MAEAEVIANATSTVALFPSAVAAVFGYQTELRQSPRWTYGLMVPSLLGGLAGAWLVTSQPAEAFHVLVPWLILLAAALFALQPSIARWTGIGKPHAQPSAQYLCAVVGAQLLIAIYGGYFGAGIGILMLSTLAMMGLSDIHVMNALKSLLGSCINGAAAAIFVLQGKVDWPLALLMAAAAIAGGYFGARIFRKLDRNFVRRGVVAIGFSLAAFYFYRLFSGG